MPLFRWLIRIITCIALSAVMAYLIVVIGAIRSPFTWGPDFDNERRYMDESRYWSWSCGSDALCTKVGAAQLRNFRINHATSYGSDRFPQRETAPFPERSHLLEADRVVKDRGQDWAMGLEARFGWPKRMMSYTLLLGPLLYEGVSPSEVSFKALNDPARTTYIFPTNIIWPNALINTAAMMPFVIGIYAAVRLPRSYVRRRRGYCPKCNYNLRGELGTGCSECGWRRASNDE